MAEKQKPATREEIISQRRNMMVGRKGSTKQWKKRRLSPTDYIVTKKADYRLKVKQGQIESKSREELRQERADRRKEKKARVKEGTRGARAVYGFGKLAGAKGYGLVKSGGKKIGKQYKTAHRLATKPRKAMDREFNLE